MDKVIQTSFAKRDKTPVNLNLKYFEKNIRPNPVGARAGITKQFIIHQACPRRFNPNSRQVDFYSYKLELYWRLKEFFENMAPKQVWINVNYFSYPKFYSVL